MSTEIPEPPSLVPEPDPAGLPAPVERRRIAFVGDLGAAGVTALVSVILSVPVGALWAALAPSVQGTLSQGGVYYTAPEGKSFIGQDATLGIICAVVGLALGTLAFFVFRNKGTVGAALGLAGGGIAGGYLATKAGRQFGPGHGEAIQKMIVGMADNTVFALPMQLRAVGMLWFWPLAAIFMYYILTLIFGPIEPELNQPQQPAWTYPWPEPPAGRQAAAPLANPNGHPGPVNPDGPIDPDATVSPAGSTDQASPAGQNGYLNPTGANGQINQPPAESAAPVEPITASPVLPDEVDRGK